MKKLFNTLLIVVFAVLVFPSVSEAASLYITPETKTVKTGDTFDVNINLDTSNKSINGVDLKYLNYDHTILQVVDANPSLAGTQITPGSLMPTTVLNSVNVGLGQISFSQVAAVVSAYEGSGVLGTVTFKAIAPGTAKVYLNHTKGDTTDSNVASLEGDLLSSVSGATYIVTGSPISVDDKPYNPPNSKSPVFSFLRDLTIGSEGSDVVSLQELLISQGYLIIPPGIAKGYFGNLTRSALAKYQSAHGISPAVGYFGPLTRASVGSGTSNAAVPSVGTVSSNAELLQLVILLNTLGIVSDEKLEAAREIFSN